MKKLSLTCLIAFFMGGLLFGATYSVQLNDTLESIASAQGVNLVELAKINNIDQPYIIWVGQKLTLPGKKEDSTKVLTSNNDEDELLLPKGLKSHNKGNRPVALAWESRPEFNGGVGYFNNSKVDGYYRYAGLKWQPIKAGNLAVGVWEEIGDCSCEALNNDWLQLEISNKVGPVINYHTDSRNWLNSWSVKGYYQYRQASAYIGSWARTQQDHGLAINWWSNIYQVDRPWFNQAHFSGEYMDEVKAEAVKTVNGFNNQDPINSPRKWEGSWEQNIIAARFKSAVSLNLAYRHLDGSSPRLKDNYGLGFNFKVGPAKILYELGFNKETKKNKVELQVWF